MSKGHAKEEAKPLLGEPLHEVENDREPAIEVQHDGASGDGGLVSSSSGDHKRSAHQPTPLPNSSDRDDTRNGPVESDENEHAISNCDTIIHLLKGNMGTGVLAMADALKNSGLIFGTVGLVFLSCFCVSCMHMLLNCAQKLCRRTGKSSMTYADVAEYACATSRHTWLRKCQKIARWTIIVFLCITQLGFCCVYFVFVSESLKTVFDFHFKTNLDTTDYLGITLFPMLALCSVRKLRYLAPISMLANLLQMVGLGLTFFYLLRDLPHMWDRKAFATWGQLPLYFGTAIYAFEGIGVILPLENEMREPAAMRGWNGVLNTSMVIVSCIYMAVGFFGYLQYGDDVKGSITLNLPVHEWLAQIIILMMALAIFFSYGLQFYVPLELILPSLLSRVSESSHIFVEFIIRYSLVLLTFGLAAAIPKLEQLISLVGAVSSSTLALMAPTILHTITFWDELSGLKGKVFIARNMFLFMIGFVGFLTGTYVSVENIIHPSGNS